MNSDLHSIWLNLSEVTAPKAQGYVLEATEDTWEAEIPILTSPPPLHCFFSLNTGQRKTLQCLKESSLHSSSLLWA